MPDSGWKQLQFILENNFLPALHSFPAKGTYSELGSGSPSLQGSAWHKAFHIPIAPINRTDTCNSKGQMYKDCPFLWPLQSV